MFRRVKMLMALYGTAVRSQLTDVPNWVKVKRSECMPLRVARLRNTSALQRKCASHVGFQSLPHRRRRSQDARYARDEHQARFTWSTSRITAHSCHVVHDIILKLRYLYEVARSTICLYVQLTGNAIGLSTFVPLYISLAPSTST